MHLFAGKRDMLKGVLNEISNAEQLELPLTAFAKSLALALEHYALIYCLV